MNTCSRIVRVLGIAALAALTMGVRCELTPPMIVITSPANGVFTTGSTVVVEGVVLGISDPAAIVGVSVNDQPVTLDKGFSFSTVVALDQNDVFTPVVADLEVTHGPHWRDRITVVRGESIADGDLSPMGLAMRLNDGALGDLESLVADLVDLDISALLPVGTILIDDCFASVFGLCIGDAVARVISPPPGIGGFGVNLDANTDRVDGAVTISDVVINLDIDGSGIVPDCGLRLTAAVKDVFGGYALSPDAALPTQVDVVQLGDVSVDFDGFDQEFTSGLCDAIIIGDIIELIIGDLEPVAVQGLIDFLADPDGGGPADSPVADAVEEALAGIEISGPIGTAIGVNLDTPLFDVFEDTAGVTLDADARITASDPAPGAVDLIASYHVPEPFPPFGATTPGGLVYDLAICVSTSAFNQLLKAEVESGLLLTALDELDLGTGPIPVTAAVMATFIPELSFLDPDTPLRINIQPLLAPVVTGASGPLGELAELKLPHLSVTLSSADGMLVYLTMVADAVVGLNIEWNAQDSELEFVLGELQSSNVAVAVLENPIDTNEAALTGLIQLLVPVVFPALAGSLETFPIPDLLGLELEFVEIGRNGQFMSVFLNTLPPAQKEVLSPFQVPRIGP